MKYVKKFVGLDVSKEKIVVAIAGEDQLEARYWGSIAHNKDAVRKLVTQLSKEEGTVLDVCYEAGPTGFDLYRWLLEMNVDCNVVAPTAMLQSNRRIKTDKRDAIRLAHLWRVRELTSIYVPTPEDEALRDLARAREDAVQDLNRHKQRLGKFLLRHQLQPVKKMALWTKNYEAWLDTLKFTHAGEQLAFQEYRHSITETKERIARYEKEMENQATQGSQAPLVEAFMSLRGVALITASTLAAELGPVIQQFSHPQHLMSYCGLVPSESSSGGGRWQGGITKVGNAHLRRVLVEAAWQYRYTPGVRGKMRTRWEGLPPEIQAVS
ncbi:MAG: family transposase [Paenibacillaceae bacterium]|jgi:transposase|nr:family transposase [Paenibacillaceae bacterium]